MTFVEIAPVRTKFSDFPLWWRILVTVVTVAVIWAIYAVLQAVSDRLPFWANAIWAAGVVAFGIVAVVIDSRRRKQR